jgi:hypothetical protein
MAAREEGDGDTAERLEDALAYAMNVLLSPDLEVKYQLLDNARRRTTRFVSSTLSNSAIWFADEARTFLGTHPEASIDDLLEHLDDLQNLTLQEQPEAPGTYTVLRGIRENVAWLEEVFQDRIHFAAAGEAPLTAGSVEDLAAAVLLRARRRSLGDLKAVVLDRHSSERDLQLAIEESLWIFGGQFLSTRGTRRISSGLELDLTLLRPDGTVHVIELKRACVSVLTHQRARYVPTSEVHRAVAQAMNYLVTLDEDRTRLAGLGIDVRRASATVIIGHPAFEPGACETDIDETLRIYNSHLSRVEVVTYKQALDRAARSLDLA